MKRTGIRSRSRRPKLKGFVTRSRPTLREAMLRDAKDVTLERDNWTCQGAAKGMAHRCEGRLEVHHVLPRGRGGMDHPANLLCVCGWLHHWIHSHPRRAYRLGLLQRSGDTPCHTCGHVERLHSVTYGTCTYGELGAECPCQAFEEAA